MANSYIVHVPFNISGVEALSYGYYSACGESLIKRHRTHSLNIYVTDCDLRF